MALSILLIACDGQQYEISNCKSFLNRLNGVEDLGIERASSDEIERACEAIAKHGLWFNFQTSKVFIPPSQINSIVCVQKPKTEGQP